MVEDFPELCESSCQDTETINLNLVVSDVTLPSCNLCQFTQPQTNPIQTKVNTNVDFNIRFCLNAELFTNQNVCGDFNDWILVGKPSSNPTQTLQANSFSISNFGVLSASFNYIPDQSFTKIEYFLYNTKTQRLVATGFGQTIVAQRSGAVLAGGKCQGEDCCYVAADCAASLNLMQTVDPDQREMYKDQYCPFPVCNWRYKYDTRVQKCILHNTSPNLPSTHNPYTSLYDCASDMRSDNAYCAEPLQKAYRICKANAGLY